MPVEIALFFMMATLYILYVLPVGLALNRGRNPVVWFLIAVVSTPFLAILLLLAMGDVEQA
ncbi:hypothetical protein [Ruegeria arenilitoris]|uniref:hypothetical protein n=1 Tax=Ruegeria arenilitoris TaxID=1173585 RepID=UPI00148136B3|nr:hypothetical protein [Ruegeria arenilitoris]